MKRVIDLTAICLVALSILMVGCQPADDAPPAAAAAGTQEAGSSNAATAVTELTVEYRKPELSELTTGAGLTAACEAEVGAIERALAELEAFTPDPTVDNYLEPLNATMVSAYNMVFASGTLTAVHPDAAVRDAGDDCQQAISSVYADFSLSRPIFERLTRLDVSSSDTDTQRYVEKLLQGFRLSGVDKDDATRARIKALTEEITAVGQEFSNNIRESVNYLVLDSVEQLAGLPQDYIDAHPPGEDGKIRISTQYPDLFPFMSYADNDELRRQLTVLRNTLAWPENEAVLLKLIGLRHELANLIGFDHYAGLITADKMVGSPQRVESFLQELAGYTEEAQQREYAMLLERLQRDQPDAERVEVWQASYLSEKISSEQFNVDSKEVREYFSYNNTRDGILTLVQDLFNVQIKPWDTTTWHADVEAYELWDGEVLIGQFYLDMHPRDNKYQHAAAFPLRTGITGVQTPVATLVCNFPAGDGLMPHSQVETYLHEFGHLIHNLFAGGHHWVDISGINTEWDFVEAPSQMLQEWVWDYPTVSRFARNADGEVLPEDLLQRMQAARDFGLGLATRRQLSLAALSLGLYNQDPQGLDLKAFTDAMSRQYTPFEPLPEGHFYTAFGHLDGYSAIYYTYQWSLAIASDLFTRFEQEGLRNVETAGAYREHILEPGGAKPAAELVREFLGREISFKPYADRLSQAGKTAAD